ncbi:Uncharacterized protein dnm_064880 [Desulfonema magnum]|uniref:Uncharacterized protein n=1 Tax=Desulfonema magnum TaxID=45655 RepID=A0A975BRK9_9BACT|nr:Uncharacterized protein dnm_064880 [Desulfonema magnum]
MTKPNQTRQFRSKKSQSGQIFHLNSDYLTKTGEQKLFEKKMTKPVIFFDYRATIQTDTPER